MQTAFVDIGLKRNAFLHERDMMHPMRLGQDVFVQVVREPLGEKGARVSTHVTLASRFWVLLPTVDHVGISRKIENKALRCLAEKLKPKGMGLILRTASGDATEESLHTDLDALLAQWIMLENRAKFEQAPALIYSDSDLSLRIARDLMNELVDRCLVDDPKVCECIRSASPEWAERIVPYTGEIPMFDCFGVTSALDKALNRRVWLKSGATLIIEPLEALTVIDVNTSKFVGKQSQRETILAVNCEAAEEIARQIRLRDLGGIILIDFIDMDSEAEHKQVLDVLKQAVRADRGKVSFAGFTRHGLMEMTRKRIHIPLHQLMQCTCPRCKGEGRVAL